MDDSTKRSVCQIERVAQILSMHENTILLKVNGKTIHVPLNKVAPEALPGDFVIWTGSLWRPVPKAVADH